MIRNCYFAALSDLAELARHGVLRVSFCARKSSHGRVKDTDQPIRMFLVHA